MQKKVNFATSIAKYKPYTADKALPLVWRMKQDGGDACG